MQQSQMIGISILSRGCGGKIAYIDIKKEGVTTDPWGTPFFQTSKPASLAITGGEGKASISSKIIRTICLSGTSLSSLLVRPRCQAVS